MPSLGDIPPIKVMFTAKELANVWEALDLVVRSFELSKGTASRELLSGKEACGEALRRQGCFYEKGSGWMVGKKVT